MKNSTHYFIYSFWISNFAEPSEIEIERLEGFKERFSRILENDFNEWLKLEVAMEKKPPYSYIRCSRSLTHGAAADFWHISTPLFER